MTEEFLELAPTVLRVDASDIDLRVTLVKDLLASPLSFLLAQTEL